MAPSWQPTHAGNAGMDEDVRVGTVRPTMKTNPLLAKAELGKASAESMHIVAAADAVTACSFCIVAQLHGERLRRQRCCNSIRALERRGQVAFGSNRHACLSQCMYQCPEQVKKTTFNQPGEDHVFGYTAPTDPEGAREGACGTRAAA